MARIAGLAEILALTRKMLGCASQNHWERVAELEGKRKELVGTCFSQPVSPQDASEVAALLREILHLNNKLSELGTIHLESLGSEIHTRSIGKAARTAYLACTR